MTFRVRMEFNLGERDLEAVRIGLGRTRVTTDDVKEFLLKEYAEEVADGYERHMEIEVTEMAM